MPIQLRETGGKILVIHVSGMLVRRDYEDFVPEFERLLEHTENCASSSICPAFTVGAPGPCGKISSLI